MRRTDFLCLACDFRMAMNEHSDMTTGCKFQYLFFFFASSHYPFHVFDVQLCFVGAQRIESVLILLCHILDIVLTLIHRVCCAAGKISRVSTFDFAAET